MTLNEIAFDLLLIIRGGKLSDDENINIRQVKQWIHNTRSILISRDIEKRKGFPDDIVQNLGCIDVSNVDASACCGVKVGCNVVRTNVKMPNILYANHSPLITRVGPVSIDSSSYTVIPYSRVPYAGSGKYNRNHVFSFFHDDHIYIAGGEAIKMVKRINIQAILEDPTEAKTFISCSGAPCYTDDSEYPILYKYVELLKEMILKTNLQIAIKGSTDVSGDAKSNPELQVKER